MVPAKVSNIILNFGVFFYTFLFCFLSFFPHKICITVEDRWQRRWVCNVSFMRDLWLFGRRWSVSVSSGSQPQVSWTSVTPNPIKTGRRGHTRGLRPDTPTPDSMIWESEKIPHENPDTAVVMRAQIHVTHTNKGIDTRGHVGSISQNITRPSHVQIKLKADRFNDTFDKILLWEKADDFCTHQDAFVPRKKKAGK